jgi:hypothetical protein
MVKGSLNGEELIECGKASLNAEMVHSMRKGFIECGNGSLNVERFH